jgi:hypothetical protein
LILSRIQIDVYLRPGFADGRHVKMAALILILLHLVTVVVADSDFFNSSSSVPSEMFAGQKPKTDPATSIVDPSKEVPPPVNQTGLKSGTLPSREKKVDMPREVFMEWIDGDDGGDEERSPAGNDPKNTKAATKRAAPEPKNIDELLERELEKSGSKKDSSEDEEQRFIEVN